jgi:hypothetical protein
MLQAIAHGPPAAALLLSASSQVRPRALSAPAFHSLDFLASSYASAYAYRRVLTQIGRQNPSPGPGKCAAAGCETPGAFRQLSRTSFFKLKNTLTSYVLEFKQEIYIGALLASTKAMTVAANFTLGVLVSGAELGFRYTERAGLPGANLPSINKNLEYSKINMK